MTVLPGQQRRQEKERIGPWIGGRRRNKKNRFVTAGRGKEFGRWVRNIKLRKIRVGVIVVSPGRGVGRGRLVKGRRERSTRTGAGKNKADRFRDVGGGKDLNGHGPRRGRGREGEKPKQPSHAVLRLS